MSRNVTKMGSATAVGNRESVGREKCGGTYSRKSRAGLIIRFVRNIRRNTQGCNNRDGSRLPTASGGSREAARTTGCNGIVATFHFESSRIILVSFSLIEAGG